MLGKLFDRLKEPSTWAGLAAMIGTFGVQIPDDITKYGVMALAGIAGIVSFVLKEKGSVK